ncbi:MAG: DUF4397 domain-containing protein [Saprospiraceae bacterium]|nr:DUF4397 domain-containing protein [Saprospiraceae bacterium]
MKNPLILLILSFNILTISSCKEEDPNSSESPLVSFINAVPDLGLPSFVTITIKDSATFKEKVAYTGSSNHKQIPIGNHSINISDNNANSLLNSTYDFKGGSNTTLILANFKAKMELIAVSNNTKLSKDTLGSVKFINLIPNGSINISINGYMVTGLNYKTETSVIELVPDQANSIQISGGAINGSLTNNNFKVKSGKSWLIYITGPGSGVNSAAMNFSALN